MSLYAHAQRPPDDDMDDMFDPSLLIQAIAGLDGATDEERQALHERLGFEGFGGAEYAATTAETATELARDKLQWLREQRAEEAAGDRLPI